MMRVRILSTLLALLCPAAPVAARTLDSEAIFAQGRAAYEDGHFERSLRLLSRARLLATEPGQIAKIELYLGLNRYVVRGQREHARQHLVDALRNDPRLRLDPERFKPALVEHFDLVRTTVRGKLTVTSVPSGAEVEVGKQRGRTPLTLELPVGEHRVVLRHQGQTRGTKALVHWNQPAAVSLRFVVKRATRPATRPTSTLAATPPAQKPPAVRARPRRRIWTWVVGGLSLAAAGAGTGVFLWAKSEHDEFLTTQDRGRYAELKGGIEDKRIVYGVAFGVAAATAVGAIVLYVFEGRPRAGATKLSLRPLVTPEGASIGLGGTF